MSSNHAQVEEVLHRQAPALLRRRLMTPPALLLTPGMLGLLPPTQNVSAITLSKLELALPERFARVLVLLIPASQSTAHEPCQARRIVVLRPARRQ